MVREGLFDQADCQSVWGLHNMPTIPYGQFFALTGPIMAGIDYFDVTIRGQGTHAGTRVGSVRACTRWATRRPAPESRGAAL